MARTPTALTHPRTCACYTTVRKPKKTKVKSYANMLCLLMEYTHKRCFPNNYKLTVEEKLALTPGIIKRYLKRRIYNN